MKPTSLILIVIVVLVLAGGIFLWQRSPAEEEGKKVTMEPLQPEVWSEYTNEELALSFAYPEEWGTLTFASHEDDTYMVRAQSERIGEIFYHEPSGRMVFVVRGDEGRGGVALITPDKEMKEIVSLTLVEERENSLLDDIAFMGEDEISFSLVTRKFDSEKQEYYEGRKTKYTYNAKTEKTTYGIIPFAHHQGDIAYGEICFYDDDCQSNFCSPGPQEWRYCIEARASCAKPNSSGVRLGESYMYRGREYQCTAANEIREVL